MSLRNLTVGFCLFVAAPSAGFAAGKASECRQLNAVYGDEDTAWELGFSKPTQSSAIATNTFVLAPLNGGPELKGWVIWNNGVSRPNATVTHKCPPGDITGAELDKCKIWEGVVYSVFPDGQVDLLPPEDDPAAAGLLFPDLGRKLRYSSAWQHTREGTPVPWDVFRFKKCNS